MTAAASLPTPGQLQLRLGLVFALAVSVGNIIGSGIMRTPGLVADQVPVVWMVIALWTLGGLHVMLSANVASELITKLPKAGGTYVPVRAAFGESMGLLCGWTDWLANTAAIAALSAACATFLAAIFPALAAYQAPVAAGFALASIAINWPGVREGQIAQTAGSIVKVGLIVGVIAVAFLAEPIPVSEVVSRAGAGMNGAAPAVGFFAVIAAYQMIYGAYTGWHAPIYFVEEDANAARNLPRAMGVSILLVTAIYVAFNLSLLSALDMNALRTSELPVALVIGNAFGRSGGILVALLAIVIVAVAINALVMGTSRVLYGMARDGLFLPVAMRVNKGGTPHVALAITAAVAVPLIFSGAFVFLFKLVAALAIFAFFLFELSLFALRRQQPDLHRPFRAIGYPLLPALVCLLDLGLLIAFIAADPMSGVYMAGLIAVCTPVGVVLHRRRQRATFAMTT
ncbi:APA family basic amino acid/polyamine antiporter [Erythromicrobium ramosum]|uniref:APA family basic amino acid/polyamine antiporter n=1 Tax=Erythrobacter ramosus TaxID=35811 RepID=A0A6I4UM98_9SPHN|nr:APC family permease [Erythrobacter ramosus]MBB3777245.1 APA family basic amino acid/polyamine antiporter [Erythrobacter ramosus]MXP39992.1 amino acid permease [Erythrobacter ramosus]